MLSEGMKRPGDALIITGSVVEGGLQKRQRQHKESEDSVEDLGGGNGGQIGPQHPAKENTTSFDSSVSHSDPPEIVIIDEQTNNQIVDNSIGDDKSDVLFVPPSRARSTNGTPSPRDTPANEHTEGLICYGMVGTAVLTYLYTDHDIRYHRSSVSGCMPRVFL